MKKIRQAYGLWESPLTPTRMGRSLRLKELFWDESGALLWLEGRPERNVIVLQPPDGEARRDLNAELSVRAKVGYGGGDFSAGRGDAYFVEAASGRLYRQPVLSGPARPITPAFGGCASPRLSPDGRWLLYVHTYEDQDSLGIAPSGGSLWPHRLVSGDDFYMQPAWHPGGERIAWIAWNHPNMPWDGTRLHLASLAFPPGGLPTIQESSILVGGDEVSIFQPEFSPDGTHLAYVSDRDGWWHIYLYNLESGETRQLTQGEAEDGLPGWVQGMRTYSFAPDGKAVYFIHNQIGYASLWRVEIESGRLERLELPAEYTWLSQIAISPSTGEIALLASGGRTPPRVIVHTPGPSGSTRVVARAQSEDLPPETYSPPEAISWQGMDGGLAHGMFYAPHNETYEGIGLPPLMVLVHGGPTSQRWASFDEEAQFFASRGYAVLQVNHRGSTGYGRDYRNMLRGNWGIYDVQDSVSGARHLAAEGRVDGGKLVIQGGSAGGFTVLKALEDYPGVFKAGIDLYGVSDHFDLNFNSHKFEIRYNDTLLGPYPEAAALLRERSPLFFVDKIQDPIAVFQGEDDNVVPRNQSDEVVKSLQRRGVPHVYHLYPGEGHGFTKPETIQHYYGEVEKFLRVHVIGG